MYSNLLCAVNAGLHLQALVLKRNKHSRQESQKLKRFNEISASDVSLVEELRSRSWFVEEEVRQLMTLDFYKITN